MNPLLQEPGLILGKSAAILSVAWIVSLVLRKAAPLLESYLWRMTFIAILVLPVLSLNLSWIGLAIEAPELLNIEATPLEQAASYTGSGAEAAQSPRPRGMDFGMLTKLFGIIWVAGAGLLMVRLAAANLMLARTRKQATSLAESCTVECRNILDFRGRVNLKKHPRSPTPMGWGLFNATILVPDDFNHWDDEKKRHVLLHELSHVARYDTWFRFISELCRCLYWVNPLVWTALRRLRLSEELATDAHVISTGGNEAAYAELLLLQARKTSPKIRLYDTVAAGMARSHSVSKRIEWILSDGDKAFPKLRRWLPVMIVFGIGLTALSGIQFLEAEAEGKPNAPSPPDLKSLYTEVYRVSKSSFQALSKAENPTAVDAIWGSRDLGPGWSAVYNPATQKLIVRTILPEHERIKKLFPDLTADRFRVGVMAFEIPENLVSQFGKNAWQQLTEAMKSGTQVQFLSRLNLSLLPGTRRGASISGNGKTIVYAEVNQSGEGNATLNLAFNYTFSDGKSQRQLSQKRDLDYGETSLIGITEGRDNDHRIAIFARVSK